MHGPTGHREGAQSTVQGTHQPSHAGENFIHDSNFCQFKHYLLAHVSESCLWNSDCQCGALPLGYCTLLIYFMCVSSKMYVTCFHLPSCRNFRMALYQSFRGICQRQVVCGEWVDGWGVRVQGVNCVGCGSGEVCVGGV